MVAVGEATVRAPVLGHKETLILDDAPRPLGESMLVRDGYALCWGPGIRRISRPDRVAFKLQVVDGTPQVMAAQATAPAHAMRRRDVDEGPESAKDRKETTKERKTGTTKADNKRARKQDGYRRAPLRTSPQ